MSAETPFLHRWSCNCLFCGEPEFVRLVEIWSDHNFQLETCCEASHEEMVREMHADPEFAAHILGLVDAEMAIGNKLRRVAFTEQGFGPVLLDCHIEVRPIERRVAIEFVRKHHDHNRPLIIDRFRAGLWNGRILLGVVQVGNPTARAYNGKMVEVRRLCLDRSIPQELRWKACSAGYTWAAKEAERRGWSKIITYTRESETGMSLRYARWKSEGEGSRPGHVWQDRGDGTNRRNVGQTEGKVRWSKALHPTAEAIARRDWSDRRSSTPQSQTVLRFDLAA